MIRTIKKIFNIAASLAIVGLVLWNCEPEADALGSQFFQNGAEGTQIPYPVIAYTINNNDSIRTDAVRLQKATLGAFSEPVFGLQKCAYVTQVRMSSYAPDFGTNPVLDSVVLAIKPDYPSDSVTTTTNESYIYPDGDVPSQKVVNTYPITKYGKTKIGGNTKFNIKIHRVTDFLGTNNDKYYSNKSVATSDLLGSETFGGNISSITVTRKSDNTNIFERDAAIRIKLDSTFFQNNILKKSKDPELADAASFIRYFRGLRISVDENDGYLFNFDPNAITITLYYKKEITANGETTKEKETFEMNLGSSNVHFNQILNNRIGSSIETLPAVDTISLSGAPRLYAQGMGGPGIGFKIPETTIAAIKDKYKNEKIGIISAKLRIYTDPAVWSNKYQKPQYFTVFQRRIKSDHSFENLNSFLEDMSALAYSGYALVKPYRLDESQAYYDIGITQTFKNIIEKEAKSRHFAINVGNYTVDTSGNLVGWQYPALAQSFNTRAYTPNRAVFIGSDPADEKGARLILTYGKK